MSAHAALKAALASLSVRNFRIYACGQLLSVTGTWMMVVAQDWLILSLTGDSAKALGILSAAQFAPVLLFTLYGGKLADLHDKRKLLILANAAAGILALILASMVATGAITLWSLYAAGLGLGIINSVEIPARMAFVSELVETSLLPNASALSATYFNLARVLGPAAAGTVIAATGVSEAMAINSLSYLASVTALCLVRPQELHRDQAAPPRSGVMDGLRYVATRSDLALLWRS